MSVLSLWLLRGCSRAWTQQSGLVKNGQGGQTLAVETGRYGVAVLSFDPGLLPIGLGESAVVDRPPAPGAEDQVMTWIRKRMAGGHGADPAQATRLLARLAAGDADRLSGRHLTVTDDLDAVLANIDQVRRDDLHYQRLQTSAR